MDPVSIHQLVDIVGGRACEVPDPDRLIHGVSTDTRTLTGQQAFWALQGQNHDGHDFVNRVAGQTPVSVIGESARDRTTGPRVVVENTLKALADFSRWYRRQQEALVIGITGSVGKTTTRRTIHHVLSGTFRGIQSPANFNNEIGVPLTLLQLTHDDEFAAVELGASAVGEIRHLANIAQVEVGVVTAVAAAHVEGFGSIERIIQAKGELVEAVPDSGFVVLSGDDTRVVSMRSRTAANVILIGEHEHNDLRASQVSSTEQGLSFRVGTQTYRMPVAGRHHLTAALAAIAVAEEFGMRPRQIAERLETFEAAPGRCQLRQIGSWSVIDDTYNSNPGSLQAACRLLSDWQDNRRRILVTADMLELGELTEHEHRMAGRRAAEAGIDHLVVFGQHARHVIRGARESGMAGYQLAECGDLESLKLTLDCWLEPSDIVLVKGSRGMRMERVIEWLEQRAVASQKELMPGSRWPAVA